MVSLLAVAAAFFALAVLLGFAWIGVAGAVVALAGAVVRLVISWQRSRVEKQRETTKLTRRTRVPIAPVSSVDPTKVGVDTAARAILIGEGVPKYVPRQIDAELRGAIDAGLDGTGPRIVVVVGRSKVGKSRALFEAVRACGEDTVLDFVAPVDGAALDSMLMPGERIAVDGAGAVLWLDDLEPFVNEGVTLQTLLEWLSLQPGKRVVVATYGGKGSDLVQGSSVALGTTTREIVQRAQRVALKATTAEELLPLRARLSARTAASIERHGLAAYLVAATELELKLASRRHAPGEPESPEGMAVVEAAVDWARCGRTDSLPEKTLRERLWPAYLPRGVRPGAAAFEAGVEWAVRPVAGSISLVEDVGGFRAYDYAVDLTVNDPGAAEPKAAAWASAIEGASEAQALTVGFNAHLADRFEDAVEAFGIASRGSSPVNALAGMNMGLVLGDLGRPEEELAVYDEVLARFGDGDDVDDPALGETIAGVLISKGVALATRAGEGDAEEAISLYDEVVTRFGDVEAPTARLRERVAVAIGNKAVVLGDAGRHAEAVSTHDRLLARLGEPDEPELQLLVAKALINRAGQLIKLGSSEDDLPLYDQVVTRYGDSDDLAVQGQVAIALQNKSVRLLERGRPDEAVAVYEETLRRYPDPEDPTLREAAAGALVEKARRLGELTRREEALALYDEALERYGEDEEPALRVVTATALVNKGLTLGELEREEDELSCYDRVVATFGDGEEPALGEQVAKALVAKGTRWAKNERYEEAVSLYREAASLLGDAEEPKEQMVIATALVNAGVALALLEGREGEEVAAFDAVLMRYDGSDDPALREAVAAARRLKGDR